MASLFLDGIFNYSNSDSPSRILISMPKGSGDLKNIQLIGLLNGEPSFSAGTKWGPIINDLSSLQDFSSLMGSAELWTWVGASAMCWKGTSPITTSVEFYLINYSPKLNLAEQLKKFVKLNALEDVDKSVKATIHGGYLADILSSNSSFFNKKVTDLRGLKDKDIREAADVLNSGSKVAQGALQVQFGNKLLLKNLLLTKVNVTTSAIEVADSNGENRKPLFYKVSAQFTGVRPLLTTDVDSMFNF